MKKILYAVLVAALACGLCGCGKKSKTAKLNVTLNGTAVSSPLTVEKLGGDYRLNAGSLLYYKDDLVAGLIFDEMPGNSDKPIKSIVVDSLGNMNLKFLSVNGITLGSTSVDVLDVFGEPMYKNHEVGWMYVEDGKSKDDYYLSINFDISEKVSQICVQIP